MVFRNEAAIFPFPRPLFSLPLSFAFCFGVSRFPIQWDVGYLNQALEGSMLRFGGDDLAEISQSLGNIRRFGQLMGELRYSPSFGRVPFDSARIRSCAK